MYGKLGRSRGKLNGTVFSTGNFSEKRYTFRGFPFFSLSPELQEYHCTICFSAVVPNSLVKYAAYFPKLQVKRIVTFDSPTEQLVLPFKRSKIVLFHLAENSYRFFHTNGKRS